MLHKIRTQVNKKFMAFLMYIVQYEMKLEILMFKCFIYCMTGNADRPIT
jgi:hypothetical protein